MVILLVYAVFGLMFGSFVSMASWRLVHGASFSGRSYCPQCHHVLELRALVPVLSYILQSGKCLYCKTSISARYPTIELCTALAFVGIGWCLPVSIRTLCVVLATVLLAIMIVTDIEDLIIPDSVQIILAVVGFIYAFLSHRSILEVLMVALISWGIGIVLFFGSRFVLHKDGLGWGDVKFFAVAGLFLDIETLASFFFMAGSIGIVTAIIWKSIGKGQEFPFGPALAGSLYICLVFPQVTRLIEFIG